MNRQSQVVDNKRLGAVLKFYQEKVVTSLLYDSFLSQRFNLSNTPKEYYIINNMSKFKFIMYIFL